MNKKLIVKELDKIETDLTEWGVDWENSTDQQNEQFHSILIRLENLIKVLRRTLA